MEHSFGIVSEGPTDQIVIQNILIGLFDNFDLTAHIKFLQPLRDVTDEDYIKGRGGWFRVFEYCRSQYFIDAFEQNDFIIIQIDTDVCDQPNFDVKKNMENGDLKSPEELITDIKHKFEEIFLKEFGKEKYEAFANRIIYAICHDEIECWLLPIYYTSSIKAATNNCIHKLNQVIFPTKEIYIDEKNKNNMVSNYWTISKPFMKHKTLRACYHSNISLKLFIEDLLTK